MITPYSLIQTMTRNLLKYLAPALLTAVVFAACSKDEGSDYETLTAEMAEIHTSSAGVLDYADTDNGVRLTFTKALKSSQMATPDSLYRVFLYYNKAESGQPVELLSLVAVAVPSIHTPAEAKSWYGEQDPLTLVSAWRSANGKYLNLNLTLMSGATEDDEHHLLGLVCDSTVTEASGRKHTYFRLTHSQGGVPAYYSTTQYLSIPLSGITSADPITLTFPTSAGTQSRDM